MITRDEAAAELAYHAQGCEFPYSTHKSFSEAHIALYDYFAAGEVCESEFAGIRRRTTSNGFRYDIMFHG